MTNVLIKGWIVVFLVIATFAILYLGLLWFAHFFAAWLLPSEDQSDETQTRFAAKGRWR